MGGSSLRLLGKKYMDEYLEECHNGKLIVCLDQCRVSNNENSCNVTNFVSVSTKTSLNFMFRAIIHQMHLSLKINTPKYLHQ
jgi:hypothetical protein